MTRARPRAGIAAGGRDRARARGKAAQIVRGPSATVAAERAAVSAFLRPEREFLQSLAGLVQGHAETVKGMAKRPRPQALVGSGPLPPMPAAAGAAGPSRTVSSSPRTRWPRSRRPRRSRGGVRGRPAAGARPRRPEPPGAGRVGPPTRRPELASVRVTESPSHRRTQPATVGRSEAEDAPQRATARSVSSSGARD